MNYWTQVDSFSSDDGLPSLSLQQVHETWREDWSDQAALTNLGRTIESHSRFERRVLNRILDVADSLLRNCGAVRDGKMPDQKVIASFERAAKDGEEYLCRNILLAINANAIRQACIGSGSSSPMEVFSSEEIKFSLRFCNPSSMSLQTTPANQSLATPAAARIALLHWLSSIDRKIAGHLIVQIAQPSELETESLIDKSNSCTGKSADLVPWVLKELGVG